MDRVTREGVDEPAADIPCHAQLQRDPLFRQVGDERWVLDRAHRVTDSIDAQRPDGAPHARRAGCFTGVRGRPEVERSRPRVDGFEQLVGILRLEAAKSDPDDARAANLCDLSHATKNGVCANLRSTSSAVRTVGSPPYFVISCQSTILGMAPSRCTWSSTFGRRASQVLPEAAPRHGRRAADRRSLGQQIRPFPRPAH
jgi:hypothetical protein